VPAVLGDSSRVALLEEVVALGFPFLERLGDGAPTVTRGAVSKLNAQVNGQTFVQTDVPLNPGNSGGPLVNRRGEVVGINVARLESDAGRSAVGIGFAIPIDDVKARLPRLAAGPRPTAPTLAQPPANRGRPEQAVERYYRAVMAGNFPDAYESFSRALKARHSLSAFSRWFADKRGVWLQRAWSETEGRDASIVLADVLVSEARDAQVGTVVYRERWRVLWEGESWRLDDLLESQRQELPSQSPTVRTPATATPTVTPLPSATPLPATATPVPSATPSPRTPDPRASPARPPSLAPVTPGIAPSVDPGTEPRCQSLPGSAVPGRYFDVLQANTRPVSTGELLVEGIVRNNCDRTLRAVVRAQGLDARGQIVVQAHTALGPLARDERVPFVVSLPRLGTISRVAVLTELP
jgi:hypothetical protein